MFFLEGIVRLERLPYSKTSRGEAWAGIGMGEGGVLDISQMEELEQAGELWL